MDLVVDSVVDGAVRVVVDGLCVDCPVLGLPPPPDGPLLDHDVTFDESVPYYRLFPYRTASLPPPPLFLAPGPPPVDPLPPQGPAPSGVSQVDAVGPVEVAVDSGAAPGTEPAGAGSEGAEFGGAEPWGAEPGGAEPEGAEPGGAEPGGAATRGAEPWSAEPGVTEPGGAEPGGAGRAAGAGGAAEAAGVGPTRGSVGVSGGTGAAGSAGPAAAGGTGVGAAGGVGAGGSAGAGPSEGAGAGAAGAGGATGAGAPAGSPGAVPARSGRASRPRPYFVPLLEQVLGLPPSPSPAPPLECPQPVQLQSLLQPVSPLPSLSPYTGPTGGLAERRASASRPASPARPACPSRRTSRPRPPAVPGTHQMALRPSTAPLRVPLPSPPATSLPALPDPESDTLRAASLTVARFLATVVTDPSLASTAASALVAELVDFAASCRLDYAASLVAESASVYPPSVRGECALSTDVLEDRQEEFQCFAAALPHLVSSLLAPEGDPDAPDIPTPRSYAEAIEGYYSSQWQAAMDAEMASWKSTGTYVDEVPPPGANIVSGMWIFRVKRPPGSPPVFKARYVARGFSQRQGVDYFQTFSPTPKMTTLRVLLHVAAQRDYELHSLDFSTAFLQGSLHEEMWLCRPPGFTGTTLAALGFAPSTADPSLFLRTDTSLPPFYVLVYVDDLVFATADTAGLAHVKSELQKRHTCTDLGELRSYLGLQITRDRAQRTITLTQSHMVQQGSGPLRCVAVGGGRWSRFRVWGSRAFVRDTSADKLSSRAVPCVFLGFVTDAPGWQFYLATSRRVLPSQDVTFDESFPYYRLFPYRTAPLPPPPLFLAPGAAVVDPLPPQGAAPSGVSQVDPVEPVEVAVDSRPAVGAEPGGAEPGGAEPGGEEPGGAEPGGAEPGGAGPGGAEPGGAEPGGEEPGCPEPEGLAPGGALSSEQLREWYFQYCSLRRGTSRARRPPRTGASASTPSRELPSRERIRDWYERRCTLRSGAPGVADPAAAGGATGTGDSTGSAGAAAPDVGATAAAADPGASAAAGAEDPGVGAATGTADPGVGAAARAEDPGVGLATGTAVPGVGATAGAADPGDGAAAGAEDPGVGAAAGTENTGAGAATGAVELGVGAAAGAEDPGAGVSAWGPGAFPAVSGVAAQPRPYFVPLLQQVLGLSPSTGPPPPLECPPHVPSQLQLQPVSPLPAPSPYTGPTRGLAERREPASRPASPVRAARTSGRGSHPRPPPVPGTHRIPTVTRLLATVVTDPSFESTAASALVAELVDFAARCRLDSAARLVAESESVCPPSVGGECALGTDVLEDRQEEFQCLAAASPHLVSGPYSSQWQAAMDAEMASWKSTGTYVDEVPPPGANIVSGMWIFRVKRPPGSLPVFKARYVARGFSQRQGVDYFQTFSPTPKMTTLRVLLHVAAHRDYELHSLDFSTAFLQGSLHEEIWLRRPLGFTGSFPPGTQWSLRRPVYGLHQAPHEWHDTLTTTLAALEFAPSTADPSLFLRTDTSLLPFYVLVYVDDLFFAIADTAGLAYVKSELQKRHTCTDLGELRSYLGLQITRDRARRTITLTQSHMVQQVLQRFGFTYSSPQATPLPTRHSLSALPSDESVESSGPYPELVGCLMYLMTCTRPDLAYPLSILARYVAPGRHRPEHMAAAKRVLRYLCSTSRMGQVLGGRSPVVLTGHADASWADDQATQRSSQGYTFSLGSGSVSWRATRSSSVLGSSCEAEIYAGAMAAQTLRWLTYLLTDLGEQPRSPPVLTKHIALRYFLARELQQLGQLRLAYVASEANTADVFTKALAPCDHQRFCTQLGLVLVLSHLLTS
ncbi:unnamed protein product [Closterium sp. NIES-53]